MSFRRIGEGSTKLGELLVLQRLDPFFQRQNPMFLIVQGVQNFVLNLFVLEDFAFGSAVP